MSNISFTIPADAATMEFPASPIVLVDWWTYAGDKETNPATAALHVNYVTGKFGTLRIYPDGVLFYVKLPDFATRIEKAEDKTDIFTIVKRNQDEILETKTVTVTFAGESSAPVIPAEPEEGVYNVTDKASLFAALEAADKTVINITAPFELDEYKAVNLNGATVNGNNHKISLTHEGRGITFMNSGKLVDLNVEKITGTSDTWNSGYNVQLYNGTFEVENLRSIGNQAALLCNSSTVSLNGNTVVGDQVFGGIEASKSSNANMPVSLVTINGTLVNPTETNAAPTAWTENDGSAIVGYTFAGAVEVDGKTHYYINAANA